MPSADVATTALTSLASSLRSASIRSASSTSPEYATALIPAPAQPLGDHLGVALGEAVDDPGAVELGQPAREPGQAGGLGRQLADLEAQRAPRERAAVDGELLAPRAHGELLGDVGDDAVVGRRRGAQHGDVVGEAEQHVADAPVVRAEVVPPVRDAVRLVDDEQPDARDEQRQHRVAEPRVVQPLGADEEQVDRVLLELAADLLPLVDVRRVDRHRADAEPLGRGDLVAHEREQRADEDGRAGAAAPQQRGGEEVHGALAPPRPLHAEHAAAVDDQVAHGLELVLAERRVGAGEAAEEVEGVGVEALGGRGGGHRPRVGRQAARSRPGRASYCRRRARRRTTVAPARTLTTCAPRRKRRDGEGEGVAAGVERPGAAERPGADGHARPLREPQRQPQRAGAAEDR